MITDAYQKLINVINKVAIPIERQQNDYADLLDKIGNARFVLLGEATHGTYEFYQARIEITQQMIEKKNFTAIAIEGDWPDAYRIHRYVQGMGEPENWQEALIDFKRFPTWMWRNQTISHFIQWLRNYNDALSKTKRIGFYGLDLYSLHTSMQAVIDYLARIDPDEAQQARKRYACFDHLKIDPQDYGYLTSMGLKQDCIKEVVEQFIKLQHHFLDYVKNDGDAEDEYFYATQNARLVKNAEHYYRSMFESDVSSWNIRDRHMVETVNVIASHLEKKFNQPAKIIIWAHNSHVGDARATEVNERGEVNIGQLMKEQYDNDVYSIGFSTNTGTVTAASEWGAPAQCKKINAGLHSSYEELFHDVGCDNFLLHLQGHPALEYYLQIPRLQRAIGVIYKPETERYSHYFFTRLPYQFDSIIHFDKTTAVQPLDK